MVFMDVADMGELKHVKNRKKEKEKKEENRNEDVIELEFRTQKEVQRNGNDIKQSNINLV